VLATNNPHKIEEIAHYLGANFQLITLLQLGHTAALDETGRSLEENSLQKALFISQKYSLNCLADDSGLEVAALNGAPGVDSAHYAGAQRSHAANIALLLKNLEGKPDRSASFRTVLSLVWEGKVHTFSGAIQGHIINQPIGQTGFGYDPIFMPTGHSQTFAQMTLTQKNQLSHRALALSQLAIFLSKM
jgi:XTP/dITP diphosphohydrolase